MSKLWKSVTLAAVAGLWASNALAAVVDFTNTTTRTIVILSEDSECDYNKNFENPVIPIPYPANILPDATCTVFQNAGGAIFTDTSRSGPNDFPATLSKVTCSPGGSPNDCPVDDGNWWRLDVDVLTEYKSVNRTIANTPGAILTSTTGSGVLFNIATGAVKPTTGNTYWSGNIWYGPPVGGLNLDLIARAIPYDQPFFGTSDNITTAPLTDGTPLTLSCAMSKFYAPSNPGTPLLGPSYPGVGICPESGPNLYPAQPGFNVAGLPSAAGLTAFVTTNIEFFGSGTPASSPVWAPFDWKFEELVNADGDVPVSGATTLPKQFILDNCKFEPNAPTKGPQCSAAGFIRGNEICTDNKAPLGCCTGPGVGSCTPIVAACCTGLLAGTCDQLDVGGLGTAPPDGIGDACQCGDNNNDGKVTGSDSTNLKRALLNLSTRFSVGGNAVCTAPLTPVSCCTGGGTGTCDPGLLAAGLNKCNVGAAFAPGIPGCTGSDATTISRALLTLPPGVKQTCDAQQ